MTRDERRAATQARAEQAAALREQGMTLEQVAAELCVSLEWARQLCAMVLGKWRPEIKPRPKVARRECQRKGCSRSAVEYCAGCWRTAKVRGVDPGELPPVGKIPHDWSAWTGSAAQVRARAANARKASAARVAKCAARRKAKLEAKDG